MDKKNTENSRISNSDSIRFPYIPKVKNETIVKRASHSQPSHPSLKTPPANSANQANDSIKFPYAPKVRSVKNKSLTKTGHYFQSNTHSPQHSQKAHTVTNSPQVSKPHLIIDTYSGEYTLLNSNYNVVAKTYCNPRLYHFINRYKLHKFKKELKRDYRNYKKDCKRKKFPIDKDLKRLYKAIKFYIWLCPDANFNILELLKNNITKTESRYKNYPSACHDYLHELANLKYGDPKKMGFDIILATLDGSSESTHRYISNTIVRSNNTTNDYIKAHQVSPSPRQQINNSYTMPRYESRQNSKESFETKSVSPSNISRDR